MLTEGTAATADHFFAELRRREFSRLDAQRVAYLDYAGAAPYAASHLAAHHAMLGRGVYGNPHSAHAASTASTDAIEAARRQLLRFLDAGRDYVVCFTANASAAIRLVAEAYPFSARTRCVLSADNHNSVNGIREYARCAGAAVTYLPLDRDLRLDAASGRLNRMGETRGLFAFPAQSNFSGVQHPLSLIADAQSLGYHVLLDAAAFVPSHTLSLRRAPADFIALSFAKLFGYPTGVGALVAKRDALAALHRPWFAGGTVDYASVQLMRHQLRTGHEGFEDGTPNFLDLLALEPGFNARGAIGAARLESHVNELADRLLAGLKELRHPNGSALVRVYGPETVEGRGGTIAFNVLSCEGRPVPFELVEQRASARGVMLRGGCFCNPGAAEAAFGFDPATMAASLDQLGGDFSIPRLQERLGLGMAVGAVRASLGAANNCDDLQRAIAVTASFAA